MAAWLEPAASGRARCVLCSATIERAHLRVAQEVERFDHESTEFSHFACAIDREPKLAHDALVSRKTDPTLLESALAEATARDAKLGALVRATLAQLGAPTGGHATALATDATTTRLLAELEAAPGNRARLAVLANHLQLAGDERGELIAHELLASDAPDARKRRADLRAALTPRLGKWDRYKWGIGFLKRLEVADLALPERTSLFAHPSCRLLVELRITTHEPLAIPAGMLPPTLRSLAIEHAKLTDGAFLAGLPRLGELALRHGELHAPLASTTLEALHLQGMSPETLTRCAPAALPRVTRLAVHGHWFTVRDGADAADRFVALLVRSGWLARVAELELDGVSLTTAHLARVEAALAGRRLRRLDVSHNRLPALCHDQLARLCDELVAPDLEAEPPPEWFEHTGKPEWGRGRVVRRYEDKLELAFESGTRTFKANAPFLRPARS